MIKLPKCKEFCSFKVPPISQTSSYQKICFLMFYLDSAIRIPFFIFGPADLRTQFKSIKNSDQNFIAKGHYFFFNQTSNLMVWLIGTLLDYFCEQLN